MPVALAYAEACGAGREQWRARWEQARAALRDPAATGDEAAQAPYRGLVRFEAADQAFFFGRTALIEHLITLVKAHRLVLVVGPSGCGKSSVLRAGLVPRLPTGSVRVMTPGAHPRLDSARAGDVVVVDQFEETFTLCQDPAECQAFIDTLVALTGDGSGTRVVLAVRADFLGRCAHLPELAEAVRDSTVLVGAMSTAELREAITKPASAAGLIVQRELTARILQDVTGQPGALPLMSHALLETWRRHTGKALTTAAYEAAGGIDGAVAHTAEQLYSALTDTQRQRLRHLLLRLVTPGQAGNADTRRHLGGGRGAAQGLARSQAGRDAGGSAAQSYGAQGTHASRPASGGRPARRVVRPGVRATAERPAPGPDLRASPRGQRGHLVPRRELRGHAHGRSTPAATHHRHHRRRDRR
ncbi:ABC transporter ATP-binding protein [Nonomuraea sp. NPDC049684]|uniref:ABC transporter ATP-binding protein n=1 Tax=Nonomuraea sp. NPDC049684 TaxID=3364356 RepID=UPI003798F22D